MEIRWNPLSPTVVLSCMLGRMAGRLGREVTWEELLEHGEVYTLGIDMRQFG